MSAGISLKKKNCLIFCCDSFDNYDNYIFEIISSNLVYEEKTSYFVTISNIWIGKKVMSLWHKTEKIINAMLILPLNS